MAVKRRNKRLTQNARLYSFVANLTLLIDNELHIQKKRNEHKRWTHANERCRWHCTRSETAAPVFFLFLLFNGKRKVSAFSVETGVYLHSENVHITKSVEPAFEDGFVPESLNKTHKTSHKITKQQRKHLDEISQEKKKKKKKTKNDHERKKIERYLTHSHWLHFGFRWYSLAHSLRCISQNILSTTRNVDDCNPVKKL